MEAVRIQNADLAWHIAADILFPPDFDEDRKYPAVVGIHPFGSCKEQTSGNVYGPALEKAVPFLKKHLGVGQGLVGAIKRVAAEAMSFPTKFRGEAR